MSLARRLLTCGIGGTGSVATPGLSAGARVTVDSGTGYKSFPGLAYRSGRLHLVYRHGTDHFTTADGVIKYRYSDDLGATWSAATTIVSGGGYDYRDPSLVCLSSGRLLMGYDATLHTGPVYSILQVRYSDDGGSTWSSAYTVPSTGLDYECAGTSQMVELPDGRIILPAFGMQASTDTYFYSVLFSSTDGGATFGGQTTIASSASRSYVEPQLRNLRSGLVCIMHSHTGDQIWRTVSTDGGATWATPAAVLSGIGRTDWVPYWNGTALVMWHRLSIATLYARWSVSLDAGLTWTGTTAVDGANDIWEYGAPVVVDGAVILVYAIENASTDADLYCRTYTRT